MRKVDPVAYGTQRERILKCALRVFASRGYDAASLDEVAGKCRMRKASLYHYFGSKEEMLREMIGWHMKRTHAEVMRLPLGRSLERNLCAIGMDFVRGFRRREQKDFLRLMIRDAGTRGYMSRVFDRMDKTAMEAAIRGMRSIFTASGKRASLRQQMLIMHQYLGALFRYVVESKLLHAGPSRMFKDREYVRSLARIFARGLA